MESLQVIEVILEEYMSIYVVTDIINAMLIRHGLTAMAFMCDWYNTWAPNQMLYSLQKMRLIPRRYNALRMEIKFDAYTQLPNLYFFGQEISYIFTVLLVEPLNKVQCQSCFHLKRRVSGDVNFPLKCYKCRYIQYFGG